MSREVICPYCDRKAQFTTSRYFYGHDYGTNVYFCEPCDARVGTHGRSKLPLGTLANKKLRDLRMRCHSIFDRTWKSGRMSREEAYELLQQIMNLSSVDAHIGRFTEEQCLELLSKMRRETLR